MLHPITIQDVHVALNALIPIQRLEDDSEGIPCASLSLCRRNRCIERSSIDKQVAWS
jgi:hypothetical protein